MKLFFYINIVCSIILLGLLCTPLSQAIQTDTNFDFLESERENAFFNEESAFTGTFYKRIYENMDDIIMKSALQTLSLQVGMTAEEIQDVLDDKFPKALTHEKCEELVYDIQVIKIDEKAKKDAPKEGEEEGIKAPMTQQQLINCAEKLSNAFELEQEIAEMEYDLEVELFPAEIWANGTLEDSSFDLIIDLNIIDVILFGEKADMIGPPFLSPDDEPKEARADTDEPDDKGEEPPPGEEPPDEIEEGEEERERITEEIEGEMCEDPQSVTFDFIYPPGSTKKPKKQIERERKADEYKRSHAIGGQYSNLAEPEQNCDGEPMFDGLFCLPKVNFCASMDQGSDELQTGASFSACVDVEFNMIEPDEGYGEATNCVDCHITYINKKLKSILEKNIVAEKNTKQSWEITHQYNFVGGDTIAGFNVLVYTKPVWKKPKDPYENKDDQKAADTVKPKNEAGELDTSDKTQTVKPSISFFQLAKEIEEKKGRLATNGPNAKDGALQSEQSTLSKVAREGDASVDPQKIMEENKLTVRKDIQMVLDTFYKASLMENGQKHWDAVEKEMEQMNSYFAGFQQQVYHKMGSEEKETKGLCWILYERSQEECTQMK